MKRRFLFLFLLLMTLSHVPSIAETRALLVACHSFVTQVETGYGASGNVQSIASSFTSAGLSSRLTVEDGTVASVQMLEDAVKNAFGQAGESDLSIFYICTHGFLPDDGEPFLLLSDGTSEEKLPRREMLNLFSAIPGRKLLIVDACHSGAWADPAVLADYSGSSISILASSLASESAWYYSGKILSEGTLSYFTTELCAGLGLYGRIEADTDHDGKVTLAELYAYLLQYSASSSAVLFSENPEQIIIPASASSWLSRPLSYFSFGSSSGNAFSIRFSFTLFRPVQIQYRIIEGTAEGWNWENAYVILDDDPSLLSAGRIKRTIEVDQFAEDKRLLFQVFSIEDGYAVLCAEHLFGKITSEGI